MSGLSKNKKNSVKIIGGQWKRRNVSFLDKEGVRPTLGRVRETLFNWLDQDLTSLSCLDLFAGTGAIGFEALSRNASSCLMVEKDRENCENLTKNKETLGATNATIINSTAESFLKNNNEKFDIIFFDPPFSDTDLVKVLPELIQHLVIGGFIYFESDMKYEGSELKVFKSSRAGQVYFYLLTTS